MWTELWTAMRACKEDAYTHTHTQKTPSLFCPLKDCGDFSPHTRYVPLSTFLFLSCLHSHFFLNPLIAGSCSRPNVWWTETHYEIFMPSCVRCLWNRARPKHTGLGEACRFSIMWIILPLLEDSGIYYTALPLLVDFKHGLCCFSVKTDTTAPGGH